MKADRRLDASRAASPAPSTAVERLMTVAVAALAFRAGVLAGLWPAAFDADWQLSASNLPVIVLHLGGAIAALFFLLKRSKAGTIIGLAYTGYSTVALGLGAPPSGSVVVWTAGLLALFALVMVLLRWQLAAEREAGAGWARTAVWIAAPALAGVSLMSLLLVVTRL